MDEKRSVALAIPLFLIALVAVIGFASANAIPPNTGFEEGTGWSYFNYSAPTITINGSPVVNVQVGTHYADSGATAWDSQDGDLSGYITVVNQVNSMTLGTYTVTYWVTNFGGITVNATRTVNVVASVPASSGNASPNTTGTENNSPLLTSPESAQSSQTSPLLPLTGQATSNLESSNNPLSTWGIIGIIALALLAIVVISASLRSKKKDTKE